MIRAISREAKHGYMQLDDLRRQLRVLNLLVFSRQLVTGFRHRFRVWWLAGMRSRRSDAAPRLNPQQPTSRTRRPATKSKRRSRATR